MSNLRHNFGCFSSIGRCLCHQATPCATSDAASRLGAGLGVPSIVAALAGARDVLMLVPWQLLLELMSLGGQLFVAGWRNDRDGADALPWGIGATRSALAPQMVEVHWP